MRQDLLHSLSAVCQRAAAGLYGPVFLAVLPALVLVAFWLGGEPLLLSLTLSVPLLIGFIHLIPQEKAGFDSQEGLESARDLPGLKELRAAGLLESRPPPGEPLADDEHAFVVRHHLTVRLANGLGVG